MPYLFAGFVGNGEDGLHLAWSADGYRWDPLNGDRPLLIPEVGESRLMRDPSLARGPDGAFHLVWTTAWEGKTFGVAHSTDLIHWSEQKAVGVMAHEPEAKNVWAPELFYDRTRERWLILWSTTITGRYAEGDDSPHHNHRIYATTTKDFQHFAPARLFYDPGYNVIDAAILEAEGRYYLFVKDERLDPVMKHIQVAVGNDPEGPYHDLSDPITPAWSEGPFPFKVADDYFCYFDRYQEGCYGALHSRDLKHWTDVSDQIEMPRQYRHGSILEISEDVLQPLMNLG